jgi:hypothetical protein
MLMWYSFVGALEILTTFLGILEEGNLYCMSFHLVIFITLIGDLMLVPWNFWIDLGWFILMEPLLLIALDYLMGGLWLEELHFSLVG